MSTSVVLRLPEKHSPEASTTDTSDSSKITKKKEDLNFQWHI